MREWPDASPFYTAPPLPLEVSETPWRRYRVAVIYHRGDCGLFIVGAADDDGAHSAGQCLGTQYAPHT